MIQEKIDCTIPRKITHPKYEKIGDTNIRTNIWYKVKNENLIPFGNHVKEEEKEKCSSIKIIFDIDKYFDEYDLSFQFFIDSREYGIGGNLYEIKDIEEQNLPKAYETLIKETAKIIKTLELKVDKDKLNNEINDLEDEIKKQQEEIEFLKEL